MAQPVRSSWLTAVAICAALVVLPLLAWWLIPQRTPQRPLPALPAAAFTPRAATPPSPTAADDDELREGARLLVGTIVDEDGAPVAEAEVWVEGYGRLRTFSDGDGKYRLRAVPLDALELVVRSAAHQPLRLMLDEGVAGAREKHDIRLKRAATVNGVVLTPDGEPQPGARVVCTDREGLRPAVTGANGAFEMAPPAAGCLAVASHRSFEDSPQRLLRAGDNNTLQLSSGASISGIVISSDGAKLPRVTVAVESFRPTDSKRRASRRGSRVEVRDGSGRFQLQGLQAGIYVLTAHSTGYTAGHSSNIEVAAGEQLRGVRIEVQRGGTMVGTIRDADSGEPIVGATVSLDLASMAGPATRTRSDEAGRYALAALPTTAFSLRVSAPGYNGRIVSGLSTQTGQTENLDIALSTRGEGEKRVTKYSGIGAQLGMSPNGVMVGKVFRGGPAEEAGLQQGDVIELVDGADATSMTVSQAVEKIRGPTGTRISMTVQRQSGARVRVVIERREVSH